MLKLRGYWYVAASSKELGGEPIRRDVEGETLVLFRDESGAARALVDRCAHRGMALSRGRVEGGCIRCPYHGWAYDGHGTLTDVPALDDREDLPRATLPSYPTKEQDEQVWVWIGDDEPDHRPFKFPHHGERGWASFFMQTRFQAPVEDCLENFLDVPHTLFVHAGRFRGDELRPTNVRVRSFGDSAEAEFQNEAPLEGWGPRLVFPRGTTLGHTDGFILPSITRVDYRFGDRYQFIITSQCTQYGELDVAVTTFITWRLPVPAWIARPFLKRYCRSVIQQDVDILAVQGEQAQRFGRTHLHTRADLLGRHIARLRRGAAEGVRKAQPVVEDTCIRI